MARPKGVSAFPNKSVRGSYYITAYAYTLLREASTRSGKGESDVIEHALRLIAPLTTAETFQPDAVLVPIAPRRRQPRKRRVRRSPR